MLSAGLAVDDPLGGVAARRRPRRRSRRSRSRPGRRSSRRPGHRPHQAAAVRRVAVGPVDDRPDPGVGERGHARRPQRRATPSIRSRSGGSSRPWKSAGIPSSAQGCGLRSNGPDEQAAALLADVVRARPGRGGPAARASSARDLRDRLRDDVVVLHRDDRQLVRRRAARPARAHWPAALTTISARTRPRRLEHPAAALPRAAPVTRRPPEDRASDGAPAHERVRQRARVDVTVRRQIRGREHAVRSSERDAARAARSRSTISNGTPTSSPIAARVVELVEPVLASPRVRTLPHSVVVDRLAGLGLERLVELDAVAAAGPSRCSSS